MTVDGSKVFDEVAVILIVSPLARHATAAADKRLLIEGIMDMQLILVAIVRRQVENDEGRKINRKKTGTKNTE